MTLGERYLCQSFAERHKPNPQPNKYGQITHNYRRQVLRDIMEIRRERANAMIAKFQAIEARLSNK